MKTSSWCRIRLFAAGLAFASVPLLRAQQMDNPVYYQLSFQTSLTLYSQGYPGGGGAAVGLTDETGTSLGSGAGGSYANGTPATYLGSTATANLYPNKDYVFSVSLSAYASISVNLTSLTKSAAVVYVNGVRTSAITLSNQNQSTTLNTTFKVRIGLPGDFPLAGAPTDLRAGQPSSIVADKPIWYVGLGRLRDGDTAGAVGFRQQDFSSTGFFTPTALYYDSPDASEVDVIRVSGVLRQIYSREVLVDIYPDSSSSTTYHLDFYPRGQVTGQSNGLYIFTGSPFVAYTVSEINSGNGVDITKAEDGATWDTSLVLNGTTWMLHDWHGSSVPGSYITTDYTSTTAANCSQTPLAWTKTFTDYSWGKELTQKTCGALTTQYAYYSTTASDGSYTGQVESIINPDGSWIKYLYYNTTTSDGPAGAVKRIYQPWLDGPTSPDSASTSNCVYTDYTYAGDPLWPTSAVTTAPGGVLSKSTWTYNATAGTLNGYNYRSSARADYTDTSNHLDTVALSYWPTGTETSWPLWLTGQPISVAYPDGRKDGYAYFNGTWDEAGRTFTASSGGNDRMVLVFHGQTTAGSQSPAGTSISSWTNGSVTWQMDSLFLVAGRSTATETVVDVSGRTVFTATDIYTSAGALERISGILTDYDTHGRTIDAIDVIHSVGSNLVETQQSYASGLLDTETAADGVVTKYVYDDLLRMTDRIVGYGGTGAYPAKDQQFIYDGANRVTQSYPCSCGTSPTYYQYDDSGRLSAKGDPGPNGSTLWTAYTYPDLQTTNASSPTNATTTTAQYLDGRPKSVTGTAQPPVYYDYTVNSTGLLTTRRYDSTLAHGGQNDQSDFLGRLVKHSVPAWQYDTTGHAANLLDTTYTYDGTTGLLVREQTTYEASGTSVLPDKLYVYDAVGNVIREGYDLNGDGALTDSSNDRITTHDAWFVKDSAGWYKLDQTYLYPELNSSASCRLQETHTYYTGLNSGALWSDGSVVVGQTVLLDPNGRTSTHYDLVKPSAAESWSIDRTDGVSNDATQTHVNGYLAETLSASGVKTGYQYDNVGRLVTQQGRWNGAAYNTATTYTYYGSSPYVNTMTSDGITTTYAYAWDTGSTARQVSATDALGKTMYTLYNALDRPWRVWGSAASPSESSYDAWGRRTGLTTWQSGSFDGSTWPGSPTGGAATTWSPDPATGLVDTKTDAAGQSCTYTYTALGQPATRAWARGITTTYSYYDGSTTGSGDVSHRTEELRQVTYSDGVTPPVSFAYKRSGLPSQITDATGTRTLAYRSDLQPDTETLDATFYGGRVLQSTYEDGSGGTANGRANGIQLKSGGMIETDAALTFDPSTGRIATVAQTPSGTSFTYAYTTGFDLPATVTSGSFQQSYHYDPAKDRLQYASATWSGSAVARFDYTYDGDGRRASVAQSGLMFGRYSFGGYTGLVTTYGYDDRSELTSAATFFGQNPAAPGAAVSGRGLGYGFDLAGNRTASSVDGQATSYTVNAVNELQKRSLPGSILVTGLAPSTASVTVNGSNTGVGRQGDYFSLNFAVSNASAPVWQDFTITSAPGGTQSRGAFLSRSRGTSDPDEATYDADGNLTQDDRWSYVWDAENRLTMMTSTSVVPDADKRRLTFTYDYMNRRVQKTVEVWQSGAWTADPGAGGSTTRFVYSGWSLLAEYSVSGSALSLTNRYLWGLDLSGTVAGAGGAGGLLAEVHASGTVHLAAYDGSGNLSALVNKSTGAVEAAYEYGPFGEPLRSSGGYAAVNPFRYSTQYTDGETGLVYYGFRYYNASLGRWLGRDPIGEQGGLNLYGFVGNSPANAVDLLGMTLTQICHDETTWIPPSWNVITTPGTGQTTVSVTPGYLTVTQVCQWVDVPTGSGSSGGSGGGAPAGGSGGGGGGSENGGSGNPGSSNNSGNSHSNGNLGPCAALRALKVEALLEQNSYTNQQGGTVPGTNADRLTASQLKTAGFANPSMLADSQSGFQSAIYLNRQTNTYFVAFAGTKQNVRDWETNIGQPLGVHNAQYAEAAAVGQAAALAFGAQNVQGIGHSKGSGLDTVAALSGGFHGINFNPAGVGWITAKELNIDLRQAPNLITAYSVPFDPLSQLVNFQSWAPGTDGARVMLPSPGGWPYSLYRHSMNGVIDAIDRALAEHGCN